MNKATQREVDKATKFAPIDPAFAAATLAGASRSASLRDCLAIEAVINNLNLRGFLSVVNGCYVAKVAN